MFEWVGNRIDYLKRSTFIENGEKVKLFSEKKKIRKNIARYLQVKLATIDITSYFDSQLDPLYAGLRRVGLDRLASFYNVCLICIAFNFNDKLIFKIGSDCEGVTYTTGGPASMPSFTRDVMLAQMKGRRKPPAKINLSM
eukprot:gene3432-4419_t